MPDAPTARLFDDSGAQTGTRELDPNVFGIEPNEAVMHQVITAQLAAARSGSANTKTRAEVRGGGRKPWRQKGLGRARQGSIRSPQWRGGGVTFGPKPRSYAQRTPRKMRRLALFSALSTRAAADQVCVVDSFGWEEPKTKKALALFAAMEAAGKVVLVIGRDEVTAERSVRNLPHARVRVVDQLSAYDVLWGDTVVFSGPSLAAMSAGKFDVSATDFVREEEGGDGA